MAVVDVDMYQDENDLFVVFHDVETKDLKDRIREWVNALRGVCTTFSDYIFLNDLDEDKEDKDPFEEPNMTGTISIIPEGRYRGNTIEDAYNMNGHYSLSEILLTVKKMQSITPEERETIYREAVEYTVPLLKERDIEFEDFLSAYKPFLKKYTPGEGKQYEDWLKLTPAEQEFAYEKMTNEIVGRMLKSIEKQPES